jgi:plasmid stability protein
MALESTMVYLNPQQKAELKRRAKAAGRSMAEEVRRAIDAGLAANELTPLEFELLDHLSKRAEEDIAAMRASTQRMIAKLDRTFAEVNEVRRRAGRKPI